MSTNTFMVDAATRRQIFIQRFATGRVNEAVKELEELRDEIISRLSRPQTEFQQERLSVLLLEIQEMMGRKFDDFALNVSAGLLEFGLAEAEFMAATASQVSVVQFAVPSIGQIEAAIFTNEMTGGINVNQALAAFSDSKTKRVEQIIRQGSIAGDTTQQITRNIRQYADTEQARHAEALVRTITNHTASQARSATAVENESLLQGVKWLATLDNRTTKICGGRDGKIYPVDSGPRPPAHWNCRSTTTFVIKDEYQIPGAEAGATRPSKGPGGEIKQQDARRTYSGWLRDQPAEFQDEILGPSRGKLFRAGGIHMDKFTDDSGKEYDLDKLKRLEPMAWRKAGLEQGRG